MKSTIKQKNHKNLKIQIKMNPKSKKNKHSPKY